jgi:hypothetical protein
MLDKEDYSRQESMVEAARKDLAEAIASLVAEGKLAHKAATSKRGEPDIARLGAFMRNVNDCEEGYELARYDLHTARGGDG